MFPQDGVARNPLSGANNISEVIDNFTDAEGFRVLRGGSWLASFQDVRVAQRWSLPPRATLDLGFRCVRSVSP